MRTLFNPDGFNPRDALPYGVHRWADQIRVLVDRLFVASALGHDDGWARFSFDQGVELFGGRAAWNRSLSALKESGVVEQDSSYWYKEGAHPRRYRLTPAWSEAAPTPIRMADRDCLAWLDRSDCRRVERERWEPVHYGLHEHLGHVTVDADALNVAILGLPADKARRARLAAAIINSGGRTPSVDEFGHRFHTVVSSMPREVRKALRYEGKGMGEVDVTNCQPLLLGLLCLHFPVHPFHLPLPPVSGMGEERKRREGDREVVASDSLRLRFPSINTSSIGCNQSADLIEYLEICSEGRLYEVLADILGMGCSTEDERELVKKQACYLFFDQHRPTGRRWKRLAARWPTIADRLAVMKRYDYRNAARELQRAESDLMIHGVCGALVRDHPDIPVLTIHDALLVPEDAVEAVRRVILDVWGQFGFLPHLK